MSLISDAKFRFTSSVLPNDALTVVTFTGLEALSTCYEFHLTLASELLDIDLEAVLNGQAVFTIVRPEGDVVYHGIPAEFEETGSFQEYAFYRCRLVPRLWLLTLTQDNQVFLDQTLPEIMSTILIDGGLTGADFQLVLHDDYQTREYVCQYDETHFNFLGRWMEWAGIYYYFQQGEAGEKLIITDSLMAHVNQPLGSNIIYSPPSGLESAHLEETVHRFKAIKRQTPRSLRLRDFNYRRPSLDLQAEADVWDRGFGEIYLYGQHYQTPEQGRALADIRAQEYLCRHEEYEGQGSVPFMQPGFLFLLQEHFREDYNRGYLVTGVEHSGSQAAYLTAGLRQELGIQEKAPRYSNRFKAIPDNVQYRPSRRASWPKTNGMVSAHIDGSGSGEYAEIDEHGRYKVRLPFDLAGRAGGKASRPIRMMQPYGGPGYGLHFPLHKGTEVLLNFIEGDPDRPIIASAVPNPETASPITSDNATKSAYHTAGGNRLEMEDMEGSQRILLHTPNTNTFLRLGAHNDPDDTDEDDGFAWSTKGNMTHNGLGAYEIKIWGAETSLVVGGVELLIAILFSKNVIGLESSFLLGGKATFNLPKSRLCLTINKTKFIQNKIKLLNSKLEAAQTRLETAGQKIEAANEKVTVLNQKIETLDQETSTIDEQITVHQEHVEAIENKIRVLNTKIDAVESQVGAKNQAVEALNTKIFETEMELRALETEVKVANSMIGDYEMAIEVESLMRIGEVFDE